ncbi:DgyrCDS13280 [Dimorphilus gyrociliatus]|uniref:DgyrCDS13280 n=1 Tax=Dimorphilus gyrociliatus TaxID=2664684 RepID=A0A7I8WAB2_9ANNE|nr:DgyrCDS13280 [Dimorphilus gyrociliatus]
MIRTIFGGLFYWCSNQIIVQRALAAKNLSNAKGGTILAGFLKLSPFLLIIIPGMMSRVLYPDIIGCSTPEACKNACGQALGCSNYAYPKIAFSILPSGFLRGLMLAGMLSAVVSSVTSIFNSVATVIALDIWGRIRSNASEREFLIAGRISVIIITIIGTLWIPIMNFSSGGHMVRYLLTVVGYFGAPLTAVFLGAMFFTRSNEQGAFWAIFISSTLGLIRFTLDTIYDAPGCGKADIRPGFLRLIHPYYFAGFQTILGLIVIAIIGLLSEKPEKKHLYGLTYFHRNKDPIEDEILFTEKNSDEGNGIEEESIRGKRGKTSAIVLSKLCLLPKSSNRIQKETIEDRKERLKEKKWEKYLLNTLAIALIGVLLFLFIYFK